MIIAMKHEYDFIDFKAQLNWRLFFGKLPIKKKSKQFLKSTMMK